MELWQPGMKSLELYQTALDSGDFPNVTARRLRNIVAECFAPRYLVKDDYPATTLKELANSLSSTALTQLFFLFTSRANAILADFVKQVYWMKYAGGQVAINTDNAKGFGVGHSAFDTCVYRFTLFWYVVYNIGLKIKYRD